MASGKLIKPKRLAVAGYVLPLRMFVTLHLPTQVSVPFNWDMIVSHGPLKACFQARGTRDLANQVKAYLEDIVRNRNRIAHSTSLVAEIGEVQVREQIRFVEALCHALSTFVKAEVAKKVASCIRRT
jgi:uncharacterized protein (DUF2126 family)